MHLPQSALSLPTRVSTFALALLLVAGATLVGLAIAPRWGNAPVVLLYLPAVLAAALYGGWWPSLVASVASSLAYNYYFTAPYRTLFIHSGADIATVALLFVVGLVTSKLAGSLRDQARLAAAHAERNATIAGLARQLLSCASEAEIVHIAAQQLSSLFSCNAVAVIDPGNPQIVARAPREAILAPSDLAAAALTLTTGEASGRGVRRVDLADWQFRAISAEESVIAAVGLGRDDGMPPVPEDQEPLLRNLLDQVALALERARLDREARDVARLRERDAMRSALLASVGEDVKPRLNAIVASARALKRGGSADKALVATVASEAATLVRYIDALVDLKPGGEQDPIRVGPLAIDLHRRLVHKDGVEVHLSPKEYALLAELARHGGRVLTHSHLLRTVWGPAQQEQIDYLRVGVRSLRKKLEKDPARPTLILNEPAVGYRLAAA